MAGAAVGLIVGEIFAASAVAEAVGGAVALGLYGAGASAGLALTASSVVVGGLGFVAGQLAGSVVNGAFGGGNSNSNGGIAQSGGGSAGGGATASSVSQSLSQGLLLNVASNVEPIPVIYGTRKVGGALPFIELSAGGTDLLNIIVVACEGEIQAINNVYINDVISTDARYFGFVSFEKFTGTDTQAASNFLANTTGYRWSYANKGVGIAYIVIQLKYDSKVFNGLPTITMDVQGKKVYDPRTATTAFSNNAALCIRDYLTNTRYGRGIDASKIDDASFISAANYCDQLVAVPSGTQARYTCDGVIDINQTLFDNIKLLLSSCRGSLVYSGGLFKLVIDRLATPSFTFNEDNILGDWQIVQGGKRTKFNRVTAGFFNSAANWQPDLAISDSTAYRALDNSLMLESKIDLPFTNDVYRAQQLAGLALKQSRFGINVRFTAMPTGLRCEVGDVVYITHTTPGWVAQPFRVTQIDIKNSDEVEITAYQYDATVYNLDTLTAVTGAPASNLPDVFNQVALSGLSASSGTGVLAIANDGSVQSRILLSWSATTDTFALNGTTQIEYQKPTELQWTQIQTRGDATSVFIAPVTDSVSYNIRARYENSVGVRGPWATITHTVIGKTAAPTNVGAISYTIEQTGIRLAWPASTDLDFEHYEVRVDGGAWEDATPLAAPASAEYLWKYQPSGTRTVRIKAVDTTGNYSQNASTQSVVIPYPPDVVNFNIDGARLSWGAVSAVNLAGYEVRFNYGANNFWDSAVPLHSGVLTESPYVLQTKPSGIVTFLIKSKDTSGNYSFGAASIAINLGIPTVNNLFVTWAEAPTFTNGVIVNGAVSGGVLQATGLDRFFESATEPMFKSDTDAFYPAGLYAAMSYTWPVTPTVAGRLLLTQSVSAGSYTVEYQRGSQEPMFSAPTDMMFSPGPDAMFGTPGAWTTWLGALDLTAIELMYFRISTAGGDTQGQISTATLFVDVPDVLESFNDLVIAAGGTRLPLTKKYRVIENIQITVQADGNGGVTARIEDKNATLGPMIRVFNAAGIAVAGLVDIDIQGY